MRLLRCGTISYTYYILSYLYLVLYISLLKSIVLTTYDEQLI